MTLRILAPALVATATLAVAASAQAGAVATCHGLPVTISKASGTITGTPGRDVIRLTGSGTVASGAGPDVICGSRFADRIDAGPGDDVVLGGRGHDRLDGRAGRDSLFGEAGDDHLMGGAGRDIIHGGAGRNRVVRVGMPRVAGEHGLLGGRDVVMSGNYAVSVLADSGSVRTLFEAGLRYSFSWLPVAPAPGPLTTTWASVAPFQSTVVGVGQDAAAYWAQPGLLRPGVVVTPSQLIEAPLGKALTVDADPYGGFAFGPPRPAVPGALTVSGGPSIPVQPTIAIGVAQAGNANGVSFMNPAQVAQAQPNLSASFGPPRRMRVAVSQPQIPGQVLDPSVPPGQYIDVSLSDASPTAALSYDDSVGFIAR